MRASLIAVISLLLVQPAAANEICGAAPTLPNPQTMQAVEQAVAGLSLSSQAGESFAQHAQDVYGMLTIGRSPEEARLMASALLHGYCEKLTKNEDPAKLPANMKDHLEGLAKLVPDFREGQAVLDRIKAAEAK